MADGSLLSFRLGADVFLIPLNVVERVVQIAAIRPVPGAPRDLLGFLTVHGQALPVIDVRGRFGLPTPPPELSAHLILLRAHGRRAALLVDEALELVEPLDPQAADALIPASLSGALPWVAGATLLNGRSRLLLDAGALLDLAGDQARAL